MVILMVRAHSIMSIAHDPGGLSGIIRRKGEGEVGAGSQWGVKRPHCVNLSGEGGPDGSVVGGFLDTAQLVVDAGLGHCVLEGVGGHDEIDAQAAVLVKAL